MLIKSTDVEIVNVNLNRLQPLDFTEDGVIAGDSPGAD